MENWSPTNLHFCFVHRLPPGYVYQSPYLNAASAAATPGVVSLPPAPLSHAALAAAAAATSQFYEYQNAAAAAMAASAVSSYPSQAYTNGFETYPYTTAAGRVFHKLIDRSKEDNMSPNQFYEYQNAAAAMAATAASQSYTSGYESYPYTTVAGSVW